MKAFVQVAAIVVTVVAFAFCFILALPWAAAIVERANCNATRWADLGEKSIVQACGESK